MLIRQSIVTAGAVIAVAGLTSACSLFESSSDSSAGVFNLVSSPLTSSSDSSLTKQERYENDIANYTAQFVEADHGTLDNFRADVGEMAQEYGITDWENDRNTFIGIGRGLKKAKLGRPQISAFSESLTNKDPLKMQIIDEGLKK